MDRQETIRLINFFNKIEISEEIVTTPEEIENGSLVLIVTYGFEGKKFKTNKLYYKEINKNNAENIIAYFGNPVYWLDMDEHDWPNKTANLNDTVIRDIAPKGDIEFEKFLLTLANDEKRGVIFEIFSDGTWPQYHFNLLNNNHWHDIIKLIKAFIAKKGQEIPKKYFSKLVFRWDRKDKDDQRSSLSTYFGRRAFIYELKKNIKMVQAQLQYEEIKSILQQNFQIILQGPPGTGKTRLAKELAYTLIKGEPLPSDEIEKKDKLKELSQIEQFKLIQFHPAYSYEDFVRGIVAKVTTEKTIDYKVQNKVLAEMAESAFKSPDKHYVLIIDEINRANLPSVLGELIYALEYRGEEVETIYGIGEDNNRKIILPKNLFIIGTMNTADRSVGNIDYALRRRFVFETILPNESVIINDDAKTKFTEVEAIFNKYKSIEFEKNDVMIGHSYFLGDFKNKLQYQVKPLLIEYFKDGILVGDEKELKNAIDNL
jgi:5-methylcytosine-specific restriction endonuclease McrBC GTP-binding regulatory subunit McrB